MVTGGAPGSAGALRFFIWTVGDVWGMFITDWETPKAVGSSSEMKTLDMVDRPCRWGQINKCM